MEPKLISRAEAKAKGLKKYFTGKPCKYGHVDERYVSHNSCCKCVRTSGDVWKEGNRDQWQSIGKNWREANKVRRGAYHRERDFGLPDAYIQGMFNKQGRCCAVCGDEIYFQSGDTKTTACVDHSHDTYAVLAVLCNGCNTARGHLKDNKERIEKLLAYQIHIEANHQALLEEQLKIALPGSPLLRHKHDTDQPLTSVSQRCAG